MEQALALIPTLLLGAVALDGLGLGGAILLPVAGMISAPFAGAVAADLAVFRIVGELALTALGAATLLARPG